MIPLATTTITVLAPTGDAYERGTPSEVFTGVRAHIGEPGGSDLRTGTDQEQVDARLDADPIALTKDHLVVDDTTGETYEVVWTRRRVGLGLDHTVAGLHATKGLAGS